MADGQISVAGRSVLDDRPAEATLRVDNDGMVVLSCPPPGALKFSPEQLVDLRDTLAILGDVGRKKRTERRR